MSNYEIDEDLKKSPVLSRSMARAYIDYQAASKVTLILM